ncbi:hypothetical protein H696_01288 [Fonticula alba]|uniref:type I protein arginine methyltransferase n=1 Tax=Fonticula alba TaxID=691883 RepID=A0A058ZD70_FONAL|nr:hypothetical protein H696_01288 [Fonticula alba]KCV71878.1 hypothetical protein H696_01288 [Fonticula alba]|eukprot:XP_009493456.1 hypothetical protein H696_01288 [Fonticula alba]
MSTEPDASFAGRDRRRKPASGKKSDSPGHQQHPHAGDEAGDQKHRRGRPQRPRGTSSAAGAAVVTARPKPAEDASAESASCDVNYFNYYAQLTNQQNMLQDAVRTTHYQHAILENGTDFKDKVVLDVGAGSGILSFFAAQAGARHVYAVEASNMADIAKKLVASNNMTNKITVLKGKLEEVTLPEQVDVIISEPMGVLLVHERMIETFLLARDLWLRPGGLMMPSTSTIFLAPFTDNSLYTEIMSRVRFWETKDFYGVDLSALHKSALEHHFNQPVIGCFEAQTMLAAPAQHFINFGAHLLEQLQSFTIPFDFLCTYTGIMHGLAGWFDVSFNGQTKTIILSTSPFSPRTHWYQIRFLFKNPIAVNASQRLIGQATFTVNDQRSYDITIAAAVYDHMATVQTGVHVREVYHLQDQQYWYPPVADPATSVNPEAHHMYATHS